MKETRALATLKRLYPKADFLTISGLATGGAFDVNGCQLNPLTEAGIEVWVELKQCPKPKTPRGHVKPTVQAGQVGWEACRRAAGGRTFIGLMLDSEFYLLPGWCIKELKNEGMTMARVDELRLDSGSLFDSFRGS